MMGGQRLETMVCCARRGRYLGPPWKGVDGWCGAVSFPYFVEWPKFLCIVTVPADQGLRLTGDLQSLSHGFRDPNLRHQKEIVFIGLAPSDRLLATSDAGYR